MIQRKDGEISVPDLKRHTEELSPFILATVSLVES